MCAVHLRFVPLQLVLRDLCAGVDDDAPCYAVLLSVHERERAVHAAPAARLGPDGAPLPAKAKHSNRWVEGGVEVRVWMRFRLRFRMNVNGRVKVSVAVCRSQQYCTS